MSDSNAFARNAASMKILLLGASGLIGSSILAKLLAQGDSVVAVTRRGSWSRRYPAARWVNLDLRNVATAESWLPLLDGVDAVINCAGVLGDSARDSAEAAHSRGPSTLFQACAQAAINRVIHFSAVGVDRETPSTFSKTKAAGDAELKASNLNWVILRPSVVVGRRVYGGSALVRGLAALPVVPRFSKAGELQVVQLDDVVSTVLFFLQPDSPARIELELVGPDRFSFNALVATYRQWLGARPAYQANLPDWMFRTMYRLGDYVAWLGWRTPVQNIARQEMARGAVGDPSRWTETTGIRPQPLDSALALEPSDVSDKWFARLYALKPIIFVVTSLFWISTALISLGPGWEIGVSLLHEGGFQARSCR